MWVGGSCCCCCFTSLSCFRNATESVFFRHFLADVLPSDGRRERMARSGGHPGLDPQYTQQINVPNHIQPQGRHPSNLDENFDQVGVRLL